MSCSSPNEVLVTQPLHKGSGSFMEEQAEVGGSWGTSVTAAKEELILCP